MHLGKLDHVNVKTANLDAMVAWYTEVLGMKSGERPQFAFPGAWLYAGDDAMVHLVGVEKPAAAVDPAIEHYAFKATGLSAFVDRLNVRGLAHSLDKVPDFDIVQVNLHDIDGNHIHVDFHSDEAKGLI
jgi:catechol 2,3-dioxygenase-like lactoylglutathione lyase family enzyme